MTDRILQRRILLADGREIRTVNEALSLIEQRFNGTKCDTLDRVRVLLTAARATGRRQDVKAATDETASVLSQAELLPSIARTRAHRRATPKSRRRKSDAPPGLPMQTARRDDQSEDQPPARRRGSPPVPA